MNSDDTDRRKFSFLSFDNSTICSILLVLSTSFLISCKKDILSVYTDYITVENRASYYVDTPDPFLSNPPFGQKLTVSWSIPNHCTQTPTHLIVTVRFRNREQVTKKVTIKKSSGTYIIYVNKNQYCEKGGILTYKVQLKNGECILEEWKHQLWAELITFDIEESEEVEGIGRDFILEEEEEVSPEDSE